MRITKQHRRQEAPRLFTPPPLQSSIDLKIEQLKAKLKQFDDSTIPPYPTRRLRSPWISLLASHCAILQVVAKSSRRRRSAKPCLLESVNSTSWCLVCGCNGSQRCLYACGVAIPVVIMIIITMMLMVM
ncbi:hypothetical protein PIB30_049342 [Stylosanthes scabra]|uniref:Uncharacterized protein n=1 Tax=Stylosanthes scabra TaxID=79078 RepID=A0ABU6ZG14_9FABA|nr:hypothetical protein [Stylosanthes scabra]